MLKMVDGTGIIGVDMVCPLGGTVSPPQPPNFDKVEMEGVGSLTLPNSLKAPLERLELIGNSVQGENPAPDNPQEIKSAGRKSKNLFNIADLRVGKVQKDGTINEKETLYRSVILDVPEDGKYRITFKTNTDYDMLYFTEAYINGVYSTPFVRVFGAKSSSPIALKKGENILSFKTTKGDAQIDFSKDHNIMIAAESASLVYEPYTDKYLIDVKVTGKNLFNAEKARDTANWIIRDGDGYAKFPIRVGKANKVTFSYTEKLTAGKGFYLGITQSETSAVVAWLYHSAETNLNNNKHTVVAAGDYIYLSCTKSGIQKFVDTIQTLQVEISSVQTPYEPYTEQSLTLTSDRPITKWDKLVEQGGERGIMYNSKHMLLNGSEDWVKSSIDNAFYLKSFEGLPNSYEIFCDKLKNFRASVNEIELNCILGNRTSLYICIDGIADIGTLKTWLSENNLEVYYNSKESKFIPLTESEQTQLRNLHSYNGTTNIMVDSGEVECGIKLTYRKEI